MPIFVYNSFQEEEAQVYGGPNLKWVYLKEKRKGLAYFNKLAYVNLMQKLAPCV